MLDDEERELPPRVRAIGAGSSKRYAGLGLGHDAMAIWSIVEFVTKLSGLSAEHYKDTVARRVQFEERQSQKPNRKTAEAASRPRLAVDTH